MDLQIVSVTYDEWSPAAYEGIQITHNGTEQIIN